MQRFSLRRVGGPAGDGREAQVESGASRERLVHGTAGSSKVKALEGRGSLREEQRDFRDVAARRKLKDREADKRQAGRT